MIQTRNERGAALRSHMTTIKKEVAMNSRVILAMGLMLIVATSSWAQISTWQAFKNYENEKKEKATGYLLSLGIPGGGLFYSKRPAEGLVFIVADISLGSAIMKSIGDERKGDAIGLAVAFLAVRVGEFFLISSGIDSFNEELLMKTGDQISFVGRDRGVSIGLRIPL